MTWEKRERELGGPGPWTSEATREKNHVNTEYIRGPFSQLKLPGWLTTKETFWDKIFSHFHPIKKYFFCLKQEVETEKKRRP